MSLHDGAMGPFKVGDHIFRYQVRGLLGTGGHAFVYDCYNAYLEEPVAIKVIADAPHRGKRLFIRAQKEAQTLYRLNHPNVVRVVEAGELEGMAIMVMEKLVGLNLREYLAVCGPLTVLETLTIAVQIASALDAAHHAGEHGEGVIHRDLKPENIFVQVATTPDAAGNLLKIKVLDFGIAKFLGGPQTTQRDLILGTAPYLSPEQAQGQGVTFSSDIFQLGTLIYEMISGICPCFVGIEEPTMQAILAIQISKEPRTLKSLVPDVPDDVDQLVWDSLAKNAHERQPSMRHFLLLLENARTRLCTELPPEQRMLRLVRLKDAPDAVPRVAPGGRSERPATFISLEPDRSVLSQLVTMVENTEPMAAPRHLPKAQRQPAPAIASPQVRPPGSEASANSPTKEAPPVRTAGKDFSGAALARAVSQSSATHASLVRRTLLRSLLIGAAVSLPAGVVAFNALVRPGLHAPPSTSIGALPTQPAPAKVPPNPNPTASAALLASSEPAPEPALSAAPAARAVQPRRTSASASPKKTSATAANRAATHAEPSSIFDDGPLAPPVEDSPIFNRSRIPLEVAKPAASVPPAASNAAKSPKPAASVAPASKKVPKLIF